MRRLRAEALALHMVEGAVGLIEERAHWQRYRAVAGQNAMRVMTG